jgi:predicted dinucleotide-binding enzyme
VKIVVIGGTGLIGSKTVAILRQGGHEVVAASPQSGVNTITGEGLKCSPRQGWHGLMHASAWLAAAARSACETPSASLRGNVVAHGR